LLGGRQLEDDVDAARRVGGAEDHCGLEAAHGLGRAPGLRQGPPVNDERNHVLSWTGGALERRQRPGRVAERQAHDPEVDQRRAVAGRELDGARQRRLGRRETPGARGGDPGGDQGTRIEAAQARRPVFRRAGDIPVMVIFVGLTLIYAVEIPTRLFSWSPGARLVGLLQFVTGIWLMYCTYAITVDLALGAKAWV